MGLLDFLKRDRIQNENRSKPFHKNRNAGERKDWFSRTRPWHKVDPKLIEALITKFGDDPMFEAFVFASVDSDLIVEYQNICGDGFDADTACLVVAGLLVKKGTSEASEISAMLRNPKVGDEKVSRAVENAMNLLETSIIVDPNQMLAYLQLAQINQILERNDEALRFAKLGLDAVERVKRTQAPFAKSAIPEIQETNRAVLVLENALNEFVKSGHG